MGSRIAAHLANAGVDCLLLDIAAEGDSPKARNAIVQKSLKALQKSRVPAFFTSDAAKRLSVGNFDDDLARVAEADWIVEAVVENFDIKRDLLKRVDWPPARGNSHYDEYFRPPGQRFGREFVGRFSETLARHALL